MASFRIVVDWRMVNNCNKETGPFGLLQRSTCKLSHLEFWWTRCLNCQLGQASLIDRHWDQTWHSVGTSQLALRCCFGENVFDFERLSLLSSLLLHSLPLRSVESSFRSSTFKGCRLLGEATASPMRAGFVFPVVTALLILMIFDSKNL